MATKNVRFEDGRAVERDRFGGSSNALCRLCRYEHAMMPL